MLEERCHVALRLRSRTQNEILRKDPSVWVTEGSIVRIDPKLVTRT